MHIARKRFGQHFLQDQNVIQKIVQAIAPKADQHIVEIGPGQGALTLPILKLIGNLEVIELDRDLIPQLKSRCEGRGNLIIHQADALEFDFTQIKRDDKLLRVIGNLPYNISTPLLFHLLDSAPVIMDMHFMLQKEVVDRMVAMPGSGTYGRLSIMIQYRCKLNSLFNVKADAFYPPPQVDSSIVRLIPYRELPFQAKDFNHFALLVKTAFSYRRKTLRNCLKQIITDADWEKLDVDSHLRPEQLSVSEYVKLSNTLVNGDK